MTFSVRVVFILLPPTDRAWRCGEFPATPPKPIPKVYVKFCCSTHS